jgi:hypothetical protein
MKITMTWKKFEELLTEHWKIIKHLSKSSLTKREENKRVQNK